MFKFLEKYLFYKYCSVFFITAFCMFPILFCSDLLLSENLNAWESFIRIPFKYGEMIGLISFLCSYIASKRIIITNGNWIFTSLRYVKSKLTFSIFYVSTIIFTIFYMVIIPLNDLVFDPIKYKSNWAILEKDEVTKFVYSNSHFNNYDVWEVSKNSLKNYYLRENLNLDDFYVIWNQTKKLSLNQLEHYKNYMIKNNYPLDDYYKQKQIYYSRFFAILAMLLCGLVLAWNCSFFVSFCICIIFNSLDRLAFFLPLKYCILFLWGNISFWLLVGFFGILSL